jgi:hypothetical protein
MDQPDSRIWQILLVVCALVTVLSLSSLPGLNENVSGDGIPNRPQKEPPIEYRWDIAISRIIIVVVSFTVGIYSLRKMIVVK